VLFLDEPTIGLDVSAKAALLLTSHDTGDMERVCERVIVIHRGRLLWDGRIADLRRSYLKAKRVTVWSDAECLELAMNGVRVLSTGSYRTERLPPLFSTAASGATSPAAASARSAK
jgi:ABC-2 type transport system ATP-binding protein